ncbi:MAG TPA: recombinase zinc beta ribbon domain-containing protein [Acidimicrobiales bacterium]|nr:recombinase zinc beta ribbon domain-containing protein [Acidimicrobiales bacterium]
MARRAFGHTADRAAVVDHEAAAIRDAARRVLAGESLSAIVQEWNRQAMTTAGGGPWRVNSLSSLLVQPRLAGDDHVPSIIDAETHARLVALHASRRKGARRATRRYLLTGLLRCWRCGGGMRGMPRTRGADLYVCPGPPHGGCSGTAVTADRAEAAVRDLVLARLDSDELRGLAAARTGPGSPHQASVRRNRGELEAHARRLDELSDMWAAGELSRDEWVSLKRKVKVRTDATAAEVARLDRVDVLAAMAGRGRALRSRWPTMDADEQRRLLRAALDHVVVLAAEPPRQVFRPERLQPHWLG